MAGLTVDVSARDQVDRILHSETFRNSEALRRLLTYLSEKSFSGEADQLKEYAIGVDAFGKPDSYDPRQDSIVRLQVSRLRQKLADYYRAEGTDDGLVLEIPKGRFKLHFEQRVMDEPVAAVAPQTELPTNPWRTAALALAALLGVALLWQVYGYGQSAKLRQTGTIATASWTKELEELWAPFLESDRPLMISAAAPLFINLGSDVMLRDLSINRWENAAASKSLGEVRKALHDPPIRPRYHYAPVGEVNAAFLLGKLLGMRKEHMFLAKSNQLSWQQFADDNMVLLGPAALVDEVMGAMPVTQQFAFEHSGIRNLHPEKGEPALLQGVMSNGASEDGEVYALITHTPGPQGNGHVVSFTCNTTPGCLGAVQAFTDPALARAVVSKLKAPSGAIPAYYQIVAKVVFKDTVPVETSYVMHRELRPAKRQ